MFKTSIKTEVYWLAVDNWNDRTEAFSFPSLGPTAKMLFYVHRILIINQQNNEFKFWCCNKLQLQEGLSCLGFSWTYRVDAIEILTFRTWLIHEDAHFDDGPLLVYVKIRWMQVQFGVMFRYFLLKSSYSEQISAVRSLCWWRRNM